ncbi:MAG TPA: DUF2849 domain-containing protein [Kiloniellaceae bacterium]|nr:DUF2849 domain-containing protein [Kiloniellaceae bacterium]
MPLMVLTANRLRDGEVIYLAQDSRWTESLQEALATENADEQGRLSALGEAAVEALELVEPYLMPVCRDGDNLNPVSQREIIRAAGPTVRRDLGKQSEQGPSEHV